MANNRDLTKVNYDLVTKVKTDDNQIIDVVGKCFCVESVNENEIRKIRQLPLVENPGISYEKYYIQIYDKSDNSEFPERCRLNKKR